MAPIMEDHLLMQFMVNVEMWYDSNDHKKVKLASRTLSKMVNGG